ncbi:MAG TPA: cytochrome c maturation protein CcmE [Candidatus Acidoferrales bacterium]|nr:cytochrome c maturation protein CcmE [Candidatus Acidoferrales bacterium]
MNKPGKFAIASTVILGTLGWLGWVGVSESKTYYHTVQELATLEGSAARHRIRVGGDVRAGSIKRLPGRVDFVLEAEGKSLNVSYVGRDPLPDTFVDGSQALVEGKKMPDGHFVAEQVQAKCASKYEAVPGEKKPGEGKTEQRPASSPSGKS